MAELNDFFIRSLRSSTRRNPPGTATTCSPGKTTSTSFFTSRQSSGSSLNSGVLSGNGGTYASKKESVNQHRHSMPPDLLANLLPRRQDDHALNQCTPKNNPTISIVRKKNSDSTSSGCSDDNLSSILSAPKKLWNSLTHRRTSVPLTVVREYQAPTKLIQEKPVARRNSVLVTAPVQSQVRVVPTWFPPANIPKLRRQGSFHGETAASRLLKAKQQAMESVNTPPVSGRRGSVAGKGSSDSDSSTPPIPEECETARPVSGSRPPRLPRPNLTIDTRPGIQSPAPVICPRHLKHHSSSPSPALHRSSTFNGLRASDAPSSPNTKKRAVITDKRSGRPRTVFKFGTLPRSFRMSGSHSPAHGTHVQSVFRSSTSSCDLREPKSAPVVQMRNSSAKKLKGRANSFRNSWHVTTPVERPDVAVTPDEKVWLDPLALPVVPQKLCTCGDTRKHVHLVKFGPDLTLTDTRYFVNELLVRSESTPVAYWEPSPPRGIADDSEEEDPKSSSTDEKSSVISFSAGEEKKENAAGPSESLNESEEAVVIEDVADSGVKDAISDARDEINSIEYQDKSMLRKLLDLSDQVRQWNGTRKHRIRSVDSSPIMSSHDLFASDIRPGALRSLSLSAKNIPEFRRNKTFSMENLNSVTQGKGQVTVKSTLNAQQVIGASDISASNLRSNVHLSYSDLLKNGSRFWQSSPPGDEKRSACVLREASLSLLL